MAAFLHVFIGTNPGIDLGHLQARFDLAIDWFRCSEKVWVIYTDKDARVWFERLAGFCRPHGQLFICKLDMASSSTASAAVEAPSGLHPGRAPRSRTSTSAPGLIKVPLWSAKDSMPAEHELLAPQALQGSDQAGGVWGVRGDAEAPAAIGCGHLVEHGDLVLGHGAAPAMI